MIKKYGLSVAIREMGWPVFDTAKEGLAFLLDLEKKAMPLLSGRDALAVLCRIRTARGHLVVGDLTQALPFLRELSSRSFNARLKAKDDGKKNARKRWEREQKQKAQLRSDLRVWFKKHHTESPSHQYGQVVTVAMDRFPLSRNTIKKYTADLKF
jgi:hypothetical protein